MKKPGRPKLQGIIEPPAHSHINEQSHSDVNEQLRDDDVPVVSEDVVPETKVSGPSRVSEGGRLKARTAGGELKDYAHRSLYARPETFDLIRELAFKDKTSAQALYRKGLFLMLRGRGLFEDKTEDDV